MKITGKVRGLAPDRPRTYLQVTIEVPVDTRVAIGDDVTLVTRMSDKQIADKLRRMLTFGETVDQRSIRNLVDEIGDQAGWPVLADLVEQVAADVNND